MPRIDELLAEGRTTSFEFFPPKDRASREQLKHTLWELESLNPSFVSITYGAGGATREYTHDLVLELLGETSFSPMAHLSCVAHSRAELEEIVADYRIHGIENILALAGDPPKDFPKDKIEVRYAAELVELVKDTGDFCVGVAAHPEVHPSSPSREADRKRLAEKLEVADFAITQFFFEVEKYIQLVEELEAIGCTKPIIPGIMPVTNLAQIKRFAELSGATFPEELAAKLESAGEPSEVRKVGVEQATNLCRQLIDAGVPGLHFYTLNRSTATQQIVVNLS